MSCIDKLPHSCGSSDALQTFEAEDGTYNGYCYACSTYVADPYGSGEPRKQSTKGPSKESTDADLK